MRLAANATGTPSNGRHRRKGAGRDGTPKHYRTMEEDRKEIQPIEEETPRIEETLEAPERSALEDFFKHAALFWGWDGQVSMPIPGAGPEKREEYLLQDGQLYRRV